MRNLLIGGFLGALCTLATVVAADDVAGKVRELIAKSDPTLQVGQIAGSPAAGLYRASIGGMDGYVTADGRYFVAGDLFELGSRQNLTERAREEARRAVLATIDSADTILFAAANPKHTVTVFTDVECGYCRKFHQSIAAYNDQGISVRYVAYPRTGPGSGSWKKMEQVWCANDRRAALTHAKGDELVEQTADCKAPAVGVGYDLGQKMHLQGTPLIVLEDGSIIGGYVTPAELLQRLEQKTAVVTKASSAASRIRVQQ
jgi:thiol:disulfide interchange protein DsbC